LRTFGTAGLPYLPRFDRSVKNRPRHGAVNRSVFFRNFDNEQVTLYRRVIGIKDIFQPSHLLPRVFFQLIHRTPLSSYDVTGTNEPPIDPAVARTRAAH
jgi:hypothetical protein